MRHNGQTTPQDNPLKLFSERNNMNYAEMRRLSGINEATFFDLLRKNRKELDNITVKTARMLKRYFKIKLI